MQALLSVRPGWGALHTSTAIKHVVFSPRNSFSKSGFGTAVQDHGVRAVELHVEYAGGFVFDDAMVLLFISVITLSPSMSGVGFRRS